MPSTSKSQQHFFGMVHAIQKGKLSPDHVGGKVRDAAKKMKHKDVTDFASTSTKGLPEHKEAATKPEASQPPQPPSGAHPSQPPQPSQPSNEATKASSDMGLAKSARCLLTIIGERLAKPATTVDSVICLLQVKT